MAKKIRFPLEMDNGIQVRSMEELRNNFSLGRVLTYVQNDKLEIWLRDRYENNIADAIAQLDKMDVRELAKELNTRFAGKGGGKPEMVQGSLNGTEAGIRSAIGDFL